MSRVSSARKNDDDDDDDDDDDELIPFKIPSLSDTATTTSLVSLESAQEKVVLGPDPSERRVTEGLSQLVSGT